MLEKIKQRTAQAMGLQVDGLEAIIHEDASVLHDPFLYTNMRQLVDEIHQFKLYQQANPEKLMIIDTDYDTDGVMSACVLAAALDVFNINFRVHIPSMANGYGLSKQDIDDLLSQYGPNVHTILTADNGTNAIEGVTYANEKGITVLVTDHHLGEATYAPAKVIVNPNQQGDTYPFKGNAGATVAWKAMLAYASTYEPDKYRLIYDLIVFAGIANVADVMPIVDENHYIVKVAVERIQEIRQAPHLTNTPYPHYNHAFHGLSDLINQTQRIRDINRAASGKKPAQLPHDEELISWYLSPLLNAPRRIHATCREAMLSLLANPSVREQNIKLLNELNAEKSRLKDAAMVQLTDDVYQPNSNVALVETRHGIVGLVAGTLSEKTGNATAVFVKSGDVMGCSARSNASQPLHIIFDRIHRTDPTIILGGGGHAAAAGYTIRSEKFDEFKYWFERYAKEVRGEAVSEVANTVQLPANTLLLSFSPGLDTNDYLHVDVTSMNFAQLCLDILDFQKSLKPFGHGFEGKIKFIIELTPNDLKRPGADYDPTFWKTLKFKMNGVEVITFDTDIAESIKLNLAGKNVKQRFMAELKMNYFRAPSPQITLTKEIGAF